MSRNRFRGWGLLLLALLTAGLLSSNLAHAANLLTNPGFEADGPHGSGIQSAGWTAPNSGPWYINSDSYAHSGNNYYKVWGSFSGQPNVQPIFQDVPTLPTSTFQASGWFYEIAGDSIFQDPADFAWVEVSFRDASDNILALYKSDLFGNGNPNYVESTWYNLSVTNICDTNAPYAVIGTTNVLVAPLGTVKVRYQHNYYQALFGGGSTYFDDTVLNQTGGPVPPQITMLYPGNMLLASNQISFHVTSASSTPISYGNIHLLVNGTDVAGSPNLTMTGSSPDITVVYTGLSSNVWAYAAVINVTDDATLTATASMNFDTIHPAYVWEAEDYDFNGGQYYDTPTLTSTPQANSYFGAVGTVGIDYSSAANPAAGHTYRTTDTTGTGLAGDKVRQSILTAQQTDPNVKDTTVGYIGINDWQNYTHNYPAGSFNVYARFAGGAGATSVALDNVTGGTPVGTFNFTGVDWGSYSYVPLVDANGNLKSVTLGGLETLRATLLSGGANMNFFMLVPAQPGLPVLSNISPTNGTLFAAGNTFSFTVDSTLSINNSGIGLRLNGADVSTGLVIAGTSTKNVSYPLLNSNTIYTAVISVTNSIGSYVMRTVQFDTMSTGNFYVKISDFDYNGGQYDSANNGLLPNGYIGQNGAISNIDYSHSDTSGNFPYRMGLATEVTSDVPLLGYSLGSDYDVGYFNGGDWGNFTRNYPAGKYWVYGRLAGGGGNLTAYLDQVTSGVGNQNQITSRLGTWRANTGGWQSWAWVPLTDSGLVNPVVVTLGGTQTLRVTSGGSVNANYFMLVAVQSIQISATSSGGNAVVSFPTKAGSTYRVFYRASLTSGNWTLLNSVPGDGTTKSVTDLSGNGTRFYRVTSP